jgi:hypothetical protein
MKNISRISIVTFVLLILIAACRSEHTYTATVQDVGVSQTPTPSLLPSLTPLPTLTPMPVPPTTVPLPIPELDLNEQPDLTVCAAECSFNTIQAAIDQISGDETVTIDILDPIHTEAGIVIEKNVIIRGFGMDQTIIEAHGSLKESPDRVFLIKKGATVVLAGLTIRHGDPAEQDDNGGGIRNFGNLTLINCQVSDNQANGGGGISNSGNLTLINTTIKDNLADGIAPIGHECGNGGGIHSGSGTMLVLNSTINGNKSNVKGRARGGGIFIGCSSQATIINSTISNNRADRQSGREYGGGHSHGGGIYAVGELQLINVTITENYASGNGGGIFVGKHLDYVNTIIAGNTGKKGNCVLISPVPEGVDQLIGTNLNNLVAGGGCSAVFTDNPLLGPLADNGGDTMTHALLPGSPAIDVVSEDFCGVDFDQRGNPRPASEAGTPQLCDLGAYEWQP